MPSLINAHTHIGDSLFKGAAKGLGVNEACGPDGLKWELYRNAKRDDLISAMRNSAKYMLNSGITTFADFREFGISGLQELKEAIKGIPINAIALGRDLNLTELDECDGFGLNVYQLNNDPEFLKLLKALELKNKILAIHAGECENEIKIALKYNPGLIIHATKVTCSELMEISKRNISVVCCPRSNFALGCGMPKIPEMLKSGINLSLGTDNVMINSPDMWREMRFVSNNYCIPAKEILKMATINAADEFKLNSGTIPENKNADLIFIDKTSLNVKSDENENWISAIVNRCTAEYVRKVMIAGSFVVDKDKLP